jgi:hypothetical protein
MGFSLLGQKMLETRSKEQQMSGAIWSVHPS